MNSSEEEVLKMIADKDYAAAKAELGKWNEADIASMMNDVPTVDALKIFRVLPKDMAAVVCLTLIVTVIFAKLLGALLPILANRIGMDPAVMANPIITTIVDALSLLIYFRFAVLMLGL